MPTVIVIWTCGTHLLPSACAECGRPELIIRNDRFAQIASIPLGYNNPRLLEAAQSREMVRAIVSRPALGSFPPTDYADLLSSGILKAAPKGLDRVFTATTGSDANETAYKAACI